jgi:hypothetical protein
MGLRGPKAVEVSTLQNDATAWAAFFYTLRDGQSGYMQRIKWEKLRNTGSAKWTRLQAGIGGIMLPANTSYRTAKPLGPAIHIPVSEARMLQAEMNAKGWHVSRPVMPEPEIWSLLKQARSTAEIRKLSPRIRIWMTREFGPGLGRWLPGDPPIEFADALELYSEQLISSRRLPSYARKNRPSSDDKRIIFCSKVLAGARFDLAPITAVKRLSHWNFSKDWAEKPLRNLVELSNKQFAERGPVKIQS